METHSIHETVVVFRRHPGVFHQPSSTDRTRPTVCGQHAGQAPALLPRFVAEAAHYQPCEACGRLSHAYGEAAALLSTPASVTR